MLESSLLLQLPFLLLVLQLFQLNPKVFIFLSKLVRFSLKCKVCGFLLDDSLFKKFDFGVPLLEHSIERLQALLVAYDVHLALFDFSSELFYKDILCCCIVLIGFEDILRAA